MLRRHSIWGGLSLSLLMLGGCLLADVGINEDLEQEQEQVGTPPLQPGAGAGGGNGNGSGGGSGSGSLPQAGQGGGAGAGGVSPAQGGSAGAGQAGAPPNTGGASGEGGGGGPTMAELVAQMCPDGVDLETACAQYCDAYTAACGDFNPATADKPYDYTNSTDCAVFCFTESGWAVGTNSTLDSVKCRCYHAVLAMTEGFTPHCFHAARVPSMGGCGPQE